MPFKSKAAVKRSGNARYHNGWNICSKGGDARYFNFKHSRTGFFLTGATSTNANDGNLNFDYSNGTGGANLLAAGWVRKDITINPIIVGESVTSPGAVVPNSPLTRCLAEVNNGDVASSSVTNMYSPEMLEFLHSTPVSLGFRLKIKSVKAFPFRYNATAFNSGYVQYDNNYTDAQQVNWPINAQFPTTENGWVLNESETTEIPMTMWVLRDYKNWNGHMPYAKAATDATSAVNMMRLFSNKTIRPVRKRKGKPLYLSWQVKMPAKCWKRQIETKDATFWTTTLFQRTDWPAAVRSWNNSQLFNEYEGALDTDNPGPGIAIWLQRPGSFENMYQKVATSGDNGIRYRIEYEMTSYFSVRCTTRDGLLSKIGGVYPAALSLLRNVRGLSVETVVEAEEEFKKFYDYVLEKEKKRKLAEEEEINVD